MNKKVIIIVLVILIVLVLIFCIKPKNKTNESNNIDVTNTANEVVETKTNAVELKKSLGAVKCEEASDLAIKDFISKYDESTFYVKSEWYPTEIYFIFDFNNDDNKDCLLIYDNMLYLYQLIDDEVKIIFSKEAENGVFNVYELLKNDSEEKQLLILDEFADGLCYEACTIDLMRIEEDRIVFEKLATYSCDQEKESAERAAIESNPTLTEIEKEEASINAHTLKYTVYGEESTEKEYDNFIKDIKSKYTLLNKSSEYMNLFD